MQSKKMPKIKLFKYTVSSRRHNHFPVDQLRYDQCWADDGESASRMSAAFHHESHRPRRSGVSDEMFADMIVEHEKEGQEIINIVIESIKSPTVGRWKSFGWLVGTVSFIKTDIYQG
jgi:hypothetical protein